MGKKKKNPHRPSFHQHPKAEDGNMIQRSISYQGTFLVEIKTLRINRKCAFLGRDIRLPAATAQAMTDGHLFNNILLGGRGGTVNPSPSIYFRSPSSS